jgi:hypothetical protein
MNLPFTARLETSLTPTERLALLQENDHLRAWREVADVRTCMCCGRKLSGRLIQIWSDSSNFWFRCPTPDCTGTLGDFARAGDPLSDDEVWNDWCKTLDAQDQQELDEAV